MASAKRGAIFFLLFLIGSLVFQTLLFFALSDRVDDYALQLINQYVFFGGATILYLIFVRRPLKEVLPLKGLTFANIILIIVTAFLMQTVAVFISAAASYFVAPSGLSEIVYSMFEGKTFGTLLFGMAITPAICEELVFRGVLLSEYKNSSQTKAILTTGFFFGLMHLELNQSSYAVVLGFYLAFIVIKTGSLFASILAHFVINGSQAVAMYVVLHFEEMINYLKSMTTDPETLRQLQEAADLFAEAEILARSDATPEMALAEIAMSGRQLIFVLPLLILLLTVFARYNKKRRAEARPAPQTFQPPEGDFSYKDYLESRGVIAPSENKEAKQEVYEKTSKTELIVIAAAVLVYIIIALVMPSLAGSVPTV